jgi:TolB-like protein/tetratricopeptide (TPR) repeat protein
MSGHAPAADPPRSLSDDRLDSWKEIAAYLRRGVRTVRRWEKEEGLPVHRHVHNTLGTVYALRHEIDAWLDSRRAGRRLVPAPSLPERPASGRIMLAVLPFEDLSPDCHATFFGDGLTSEMIARLGQLRPERLGVIARTTVMQYRAAAKTVRQIGDELGVQFVLEGTVRQEAGRARITAELILVRDQTQVWAGEYEQPISSILALQRHLAIEIGRGIDVALAPAPESAPALPGRVQPQAYLACLKGRHFLRRFTADSVRRSIEYFREAIEADPTYAAAHAALAEAYAHLPVWGERPSSETLQLAMASAQRALELDPEQADAYASLGLVLANYVWDWEAAERHFQRALELNPGSVSAGQWYAEFLGEMGRCDEALAILDESGLHDPLSPGIHASAAFALWLARRYVEADARAALGLEIEPNYPMALIRRGVVSVCTGAYDAAVEAFRSAQGATPPLLACTALLGYTYGRAGRREEAEAVLNELRSLERTRYVPAFLLAGVHLGLGDEEEALRLFEREWRARGWYLLLLNRSPLYDPLRSHPRFQALLRRMSFPAST